MTVAASDRQGSAGQTKQHLRIVFENNCDSVRIVYWCAEHPSHSLEAVSVCSREASQRTGIAAPLYAVIRQREFQWSFPQGTRIRYVACTDSSYPTSDFRCASPAPRPGP